jgi:uncharacterized membrane protein HdeD (DUF308 family)
MAVEHPRSAWLTIEGVVLIVLGAAALVAPLIAGLATAFFVGWLLIMAGILGFLSAFAGRAHVHLGWSIVSAIVALVVGVLLILFPLVGTLGLALLIAAYLLLDGVALIGLSLDQRKKQAKAWGWLLVSGIVDIVLAAVIVFLSAVGSAVFIGIIIGIDLIIAGIALIAVHRTAAASTV